MVRLRVVELLAQRRMRQIELSRLTGIRASTISSYWNDTAKQITFEQIDKLCDALNCEPGDLFERIKDEHPD